MRLAEVADICRVPTVVVSQENSLGEAVLAMCREEAAAIRIEGRGDAVLTAESILRYLAASASLLQAWNGQVTAVQGTPAEVFDGKDRVSGVIAKMATGTNRYLSVKAEAEAGVLCLTRLLQLENANLQGEVQHLQIYIDMLHEAPND